MGYRTYLGIIKKSELEDLLKCTTVEELDAVYTKYGWEHSKDDYGGEEHWYFPVYRLDYRAKFEFGKYADLGKDFDSKKRDIFSQEHPLFSQFAEHDFSYGSEELFLAAIENYRCKIRDYFSGLLLEVPKKDSWEELEYNILADEDKANWRNNRLLSAVKDKAHEWSDEVCKSWNVYPYNLEKDNDALVNSWLYEYEIFELVRLYKTFDPETEALIYYGW